MAPGREEPRRRAPGRPGPANQNHRGRVLRTEGDGSRLREQDPSPSVRKTRPLQNRKLVPTTNGNVQRLLPLLISSSPVPTNASTWERPVM